MTPLDRPMRAARLVAVAGPSCWSSSSSRSLMGWVRPLTRFGVRIRSLLGSIQAGKPVSGAEPMDRHYIHPKSFAKNFGQS